MQLEKPLVVIYALVAREPATMTRVLSLSLRVVVVRNISDIQGGSNMTGTICV